MVGVVAVAFLPLLVPTCGWYFYGVVLLRGAHNEARTSLSGRIKWPCAPTNQERM